MVADASEEEETIYIRNSMEKKRKKECLKAVCFAWKLKSLKYPFIMFEISVEIRFESSQIYQKITKP